MLATIVLGPVFPGMPLLFDLFGIVDYWYRLIVI
jgi:hypothetical protein